MFYRVSCLFVVVSLGIAALPANAAPAFKAEQYTEVEIKALQTQPEEYKNKKICYTSRYGKAMVTFPSYAERNGIKAGKYFWLLIQPATLPVVAKKNDDMNALIMALKSGAKVKVYGKVRKFKVPPNAKMLPRYYLDLAHIDILEQSDSKDGGGDS